MTGVHGPPQRTHGDHDNNVKVYVRVKPARQTEKTCLEVQGTKSIAIGARNLFTYDSVLDSSCTQEDMYQAVGKSMTENCLRGYNGTVFAYGQTGSGKTFTIQGPDADSASTAVQDPQRGLAPRILQNLFALINRDVNNSGGNHVYTVKCSLFEIYNEHITDLLQPHAANLTIYDKPGQGTIIDGAKEQEVSSAEEAIELLLSAAKHRHVSSTGMNDQSSRSHMIFSVYIRATKRALGEQGAAGSSSKSGKKRGTHSRSSVTKVQYSRLNLVDLAGSERQKQTKATGQRLKEAMSINKSLTNLALVIRALVDVAKGKQAHVHYRDSKLTYLLKDSLGGNSKTSIIATVNPLESSFQDSLATLTFASRAKMMKNKAVVNENINTNVASLQMEVVRLRKELQVARAKNSPSPTHRGTENTPPASARDSPQGQHGGQFGLAGALAGLPKPENLAKAEHEKMVQDLENRILHLEKMLQAAVESDLKRMAEQKERDEKMEKLEKLAKENERSLVANKLLLKMKSKTVEDLLSADEQSASLSKEQQLQRLAEIKEKEDLLQEISLLQEQLKHNPKVTEYEVRLLELNESVRNYDQMFSDDLVSYREQVLQLQQAKATLQRDVTELVEEKHGILRKLSKAVMNSPRIGSPALSCGRRYPLAAFSSPRVVKKAHEMDSWRQHIQSGEEDEELRRSYEEARHQISLLQEEIEQSNEEHHQLEEFLRKELASAESLVKMQDKLLQDIGSDGEKYSEEEVRELLESVVELKEQLELVMKEMVHKEDQLELVELELKATKEQEEKMSSRLEKAQANLDNAMVTVEKQQELIQTLQARRNGASNDSNLAALEENQALRQEVLNLSTLKEEQEDELISLRQSLDKAHRELESLTKDRESIRGQIEHQEEKLSATVSVLAEKDEQLHRLLDTQESTEAKLAQAEEQRETMALEVLELKQQLKALEQEAKEVDEIHRDQTEELKACVKEQLQEMRQQEDALAACEQKLRLLECDLEMAEKEKQELKERVSVIQRQMRTLVDAEHRDTALEESWVKMQADAEERIADLEGLLVRMKKDSRKTEAEHCTTVEHLKSSLAASESKRAAIQSQLDDASDRATAAEAERDGLLERLESTAGELACQEEIVLAQAEGQERVKKAEEEAFERCQRLEAENRQLREKQKAMEQELAEAKRSCELLQRRR